MGTGWVWGPTEPLLHVQPWWLPVLQVTVSKRGLGFVHSQVELLLFLEVILQAGGGCGVTSVRAVAASSSSLLPHLPLGWWLSGHSEGGGCTHVGICFLTDDFSALCGGWTAMNLILSLAMVNVGPIWLAEVSGSCCLCFSWKVCTGPAGHRRVGGW